MPLLGISIVFFLPSFTLDCPSDIIYYRSDNSFFWQENISFHSISPSSSSLLWVVALLLLWCFVFFLLHSFCSNKQWRQTVTIWMDSIHQICICIFFSHINPAPLPLFIATIFQWRIQFSREASMKYVHITHYIYITWWTHTHDTYILENGIKRIQVVAHVETRLPMSMVKLLFLYTYD